MAWQPGLNREQMCTIAQPLDGHFVNSLASAAAEAGVWIVFGMLETLAAGGDRPHNTTVVIDATGRIVGSYRKTHLYDAFGMRESALFTPGDELFRPLATPFGCMGLFVCYELRFPEVARRQAEDGADLLVVPSAWVAGPMKEYHWRQLVITRAIENTVYVIAIDQVGNNFVGRSLIVDPMGVVLAEGSEVESMLYTEIDVQRVIEVRGKLPSLGNRRTELY
jgi:predicted amidohydrolase